MFAQRLGRDPHLAPEGVSGRFASHLPESSTSRRYQPSSDGRFNTAPALARGWSFSDIPVFQSQVQPQHDSAGVADEDKTEGQPKTVTAVKRTHLTAKIPAKANGGASEKQGVHFSEPLGAAAKEQADGVAATFGYKNSITRANKHPDPGDFGTTWPYFAMEKRHANLDKGIYTATADVDAQITFAVEGRGRTNIASPDDAAITQANYQTVVHDLTPLGAGS